MLISLSVLSKAVPIWCSVLANYPQPICIFLWHFYLGPWVSCLSDDGTTNDIFSFLSISEIQHVLGPWWINLSSYISSNIFKDKRWLSSLLIVFSKKITSNFFHWLSKTLSCKKLRKQIKKLIIVYSSNVLKYKT